MLKHRVIPVLLTDGSGQCVKPVAFKRPYRRLGTMEQYIRVTEGRNVDELIILDITASEQKREPNFEKLCSWSDNLFCPVTYGGGIRTTDHIRLALSNGADKVAIKTNYNIINKAARQFGSQAIVGVIDNVDSYYNYVVSTDLALAYEDMGAGEILLNDVTRDGTLDGYDCNLIYNVSRAVKIPVIAIGGCGDPADMEQALEAGASAVAAGSMFIYTDYTPINTARYLYNKGHPTRV